MTITKELEATIQVAFAEAKRRRHEFVTLEHVLFALIRDASAAKILKGAGADLKRLEADLEQFFAENVEPLPEGKEYDEREPQHTAAFWRALQRAAMHVQGTGKEHVDGAALMIAMFRERESQAVFLLEKQGVKRLDVLRYVSHGITKAQAQAQPAAHGDEEKIPTKRAKRRPKIALESLRAEPGRARARRQDRSADRARWRIAARHSGAGAAAARTTRCSSASRAWARPPSSRAWRWPSSRRRCRPT